MYMIFSPLFNLWNFRKITSFKIGNVPKVNRTPKNPYMYLSTAFLSKALLIVILKKNVQVCAIILFKFKRNIFTIIEPCIISGIYQKTTTFEIGTLPKVDKTQANPYMYLLKSFLSSA